MTVFSNCSYPLRVDRMDVEIEKTNLLAFFHNRSNFKSLEVKFIYHLGLKIRKYEISVLLVHCD
jgi:hypothetical protein